MHPRIFTEFEKIFALKAITGSVLEIGAVPSEASLLQMKSLANVSEKVGINIGGPYAHQDIKFIQGNGNKMDCFEDNSFNAVLSNAVLEHDKFFWKTIAEIHRVTKPGGTIAIGVPGYIPLPGNVGYFDESNNINAPSIADATITFRVHDAPGDYYRFTQQTIREVFFQGMDNIVINALMLPPRLIGVCTKPEN